MFRDPTDFHLNKQGNVKKLCLRHAQKRGIEETYDEWEAFILEIRAWNKEVMQKL